MKTRVSPKMRLMSASAMAGGLAVFSTLAAPLATAQEEVPAAQEETADTSKRLETVTVSARRVETNLQTTAVAVTALGAEALDTRQINDVNAIQYNAPNVTIQPLNGNSGASVSIRGMAGVENTSASDPAVGIYVDGVYSARSSLGLLELVDVERVEVLRGPQGTLFGRNTTGGALNITTPTPDGEFGGRLTGRLGEYDTRDILGHINLPISGENVAARISFKHGEHSGYGQSEYTGRELADLESNFLRGVLRIAPEGSPWDLTLAADTFKREGNGPIAALVDVNPAGLSGAFLGYAQYISTDFYSNFSATDQFEDVSANGVSATLNWDLGGTNFKSITALRSVRNHILADIEGTPNPQIAGPAIVLPSPPLPVPGIVIPTGIQYEQDNDQDKQFTQELQLTGRTGQLTWIAGAFYFTEHNDDLTTSSTAVTVGEIENDSVAVYVEGDFAFSDVLSLTAGLRYTQDDRSLVMGVLAPGGAACTLPAAELDAPGSCQISRSVDYDYLSYNLGLNYQINEDMFAYAKTSRATRAGGFNHRIFAPAYEPEEVTNYEIGLKTELFDNRVRANFSAFLMDYQNVQRTAVVVIGGAPTATTTNAAEASVPGFEAELDVIANDYFSFGGSLGWLDPEYDTFDDNGRDRSGEPFTYSADYTYNVYATATMPLSFGDLVLHADYGFKGDTYFDTVDLDRDVQEGYGLLNLRAALQFDKHNLELAIFGKNVTDEEYNTYILDLNNSLGYTTAFRGTPSVWGAEATVRF
jgi:iron complex outermembrane recepter protein